ADPDDLGVAPQLLAQHAQAAIDPLADGLGLQRGFALRRERRPLGLLPGAVGLPIRDQVLRHVWISPRGAPASRTPSGRGTPRRVSCRREDPATPPGDIARRTPAARDAAAPRTCCR